MKTRSRTSPSFKGRRAQSIFSAKGRRALAQWLSFEPVLLAFDLDGTLVPLIKDFTRVRLASRTRHLLVKLNRTRPVIIVSGRSVNDLAKIVKVKKLKLIGNHGLEGVKKISRPLHVRVWHRQLEAVLKGQKGVQIEDKKISISVHYRNSPRRQAVQKIMLKVIPDLQGPIRVIMGKSVFNLIPDFGQNKGWAVRQLMKKYGCRRAVYLGDDITDEDVFMMHDKNIMGVHVGGPSKTAAPYILRSQGGVNRLLTAILKLS